MALVSVFSLLTLAIVLGAQLMRPSSLLPIARAAFFVSAVFLLFIASYFTYHQYFLWKAHPVSQFLLPPYQDIDYFVSYSFFNFFLQPLLSLGIAVLGFGAAKILNQKFQGRFFEPVEYYLFALGLLLAGHPGWLYYSLILFLAGLIGSIVVRGRFSFYYFWLPAALLAILINTTLNFLWLGFLTSS